MSRRITRRYTQTQTPNLFVKFLTNITVIFTVVYGLTTAVLIGLWLIFGETNTIINLFVNTMPISLFPSLILLILIILVRKWKFLIMLVAALAMFIMLYGTIFRPLGSTSLPRGTPVTLMTYNILFSNEDMASVERIIREQNADIVGLQEVTQEQRDYIDANLQDLYPYTARPNRLIGEHGQLILSKLPISTVSTGQTVRAFIDVTEDISMVVYSVQLTSPLNDASNFDDSTRVEDANRIRRAGQNEREPLIILGDFNMSDATQEYTRFTDVFTDVFRHTSAGFGSTFPNLRVANPALGFMPSLIRLDYVFASRDVQPVSAQVIREGASDHFPIVVTVRVP